VPPVVDNQNSQTAGINGPTLLQDQHLIEKLARFNRERIPERASTPLVLVHMVILKLRVQTCQNGPKMLMFETLGKRTEMFARFSVVANSRGGPDLARDPRGFAMKFLH